MSVAASKELNELPWRVDTDCLPASSHSPDAVICFDSDLLLCPPLRVLVPASYPLDPAVIQFDRSFPRGVQISSQLSTIDCLFDTRQPWRMSVAASKELNELPWRVDTDCLPASSHSPDAVICFDSDLLLCPPLRVLVPASYPLDPAVIQFDRSFPRGVQISSQLSTLPGEFYSA
ncbi:hypothetical protein OESDEN_15281 [Oesophagostomum dentatum]|uniref:ARC105/Med15 mediator subunit C-terminal domain-containing protein n=1 Tax=Oesophagostomum dentatum TaxID=61180 RepID=A0A0B1SI26_OESDE|nr:hypothetical protein OESDEN_15281 [Oesophagostomum dentatum]